MKQTQDETYTFVERVGAFFEQAGVPATSGRILGHLLVCDPAVQSSTELAAALHTTSGSISTNTRMLVQTGLIQRTPIRGRRGIFFRIAPGVWDTLLDLQIKKIRAFRTILDEGVHLLAEAPPQRRARVVEARDYYAFLEGEFPLLKQHHRQGKQAALPAEAAPPENATPPSE